MGRSIRMMIGSIAGALVLAMGLALGGGFATAQDATPTITEDDVPRPAHIHYDTCEELGDVAYGLNDLTGVTIQGSPEASPIVDDVDDPEIVQGEVVIESITEVDTGWDTLIDEDASYAINVHDSAENMGVYIACGDIEGEPEDGRLTIEMQELNGSGFSGSAVLEETSENIITVTVTLTDTSDAGTPAS